MIDLSSIKKILIIRYRFVGDTVLATSFIKNVKKYFPDSHIDVLVSPNSGELIENNPNVSNVIYLDNTKVHKYEKGGRGQESGVGSSINNRVYPGILSCSLALRKEKYDIAFVLKRSFSSALLAFLSGARYRIGFATELRSFLLTHRVKYCKNIHELDNFLNCLKLLEISPRRFIPEVFPSEREKNIASGFLIRLKRTKPRILIHATSAHPYKVWPKRYFAELIDLLHKDFNAQFIFTGAKSDKEVYNEILNWCKHKKEIRFLNLCGLTSLCECFAIYQGLDLAICVDSGNAHLAAASNIPTYVLYGPTEPNLWLPVGQNVFPIQIKQLLDCQPCNVKVECSHISCMKLLLPAYCCSFIANSLAMKGFARNPELCF